jgi:DNA-binding response OmpR family regulator
MATFSNLFEHGGTRSQRQAIELLTICSNPVDCDRLRSIINETNWTFHCAGTLQHALNLLRVRAVPIVLCAAGMSDSNWKDVIRSVKELTEEPAVIVFTEEADERLWSEMIRNGAQDVLTKPFDAADLYEVVSLSYRDWSVRRARAISGAHSSSSGVEQR